MEAQITDFDRDGHTDILWHNTVTGQTYIWLLSGAVLTEEVEFGFHDLVWRIAE